MDLMRPVLRGGDETLDVILRNPSMHVIEEAKTRHRGVTSVHAEVQGAYAICLDNSISRMSSKLVYVYLVTYIESEWQQYQQEIEDVHLTVANFSVSISKVQQSLTDANVHQAQSRMHVVKDWYLIMNNNDYVQRYSIVQCIIVICSSCFQVYFVRRLFRTSNVTPKTSKPRA